MEREPDPKSEIWICQIPGRISIGLEDLRTGRVRTISVKGEGQVLRLTDVQRELAEEKIRHPKLNPFRNGMLQRRQSDTPRSADELSVDDLKAFFELADDEFQGILGALSEVNVRRLRAVAAEVEVSYNKVKILDDFIEEHYSVGGDTPTYRAIMEDPAGVL